MTPPAPKKSSPFNTTLVSLNPAKVQTESWWLTQKCQQDRGEFQRECERRHPSGVGAPYRRVT